MKKFSLIICILYLFIFEQTYSSNLKNETYKYIIHTGGLIYDSNLKKVSEEEALKGVLSSFRNPKNIDKLGLFKEENIIFTGWEPTESSADYYLLGKIDFSDGTRADFIKAGGLYFIYYDSKYYSIPTLSGMDPSQILKDKVILDEEDKFLNILKDLYVIPKEIHFEKSGKQYKLKYQKKIDNYGITQLSELKDLSEQIGKKLYIESRTEEPIYDKEVLENISMMKDISQKKDGDLSRSYAEVMREQLDTFKGDALYLKLTENQYALYVLDIPDGGYAGAGGHPQSGINALTKYVYANLKNGKRRNLVQYTHTSWRQGCGSIGDGQYLALLKPSYSLGSERGILDKSDFKVIGDIQGSPIFGFKDKNHSYLKGLYNSKVTRKVPIFNNFIANMPVFIWIDPFGRTVIFSLIKYFGGDVLDTCM